MTTFLLAHMPGCTPLSPCASCEAVNFLRGKLSEQDFAALLEKVRTATVKSGSPYSHETPVPLDALVDEVLRLPVRASCCLKNDNIRTIGELVQKTEAEMLRTPNFGPKSLRDLKEELARVGRRLGETA
jgi:DNA-directed RNA polymerase alpha subunit